MKLDWEGRIVDNKSIMVIKAALPFLDIPVGNVIDMEGLLRAVRCHCRESEQRFIDMLLNIFMMKRIFSMITLMNSASSSSSEGGMEGVLDMLKSQMPKEQQEMFEMMSMMMATMSEMSETSEDLREEEDQNSMESLPDVWRNIVNQSE